MPIYNPGALPSYLTYSDPWNINLASAYSQAAATRGQQSGTMLGAYNQGYRQPTFGAGSRSMLASYQKPYRQPGFLSPRQGQGLMDPVVWASQQNQQAQQFALSLPGTRYDPTPPPFVPRVIDRPVPQTTLPLPRRVPVPQGPEEEERSRRVAQTQHVATMRGDNGLPPEEVARAKTINRQRDESERAEALASGLVTPEEVAAYDRQRAIWANQKGGEIAMPPVAPWRNKIWARRMLSNPPITS